MDNNSMSKEAMMPQQPATLELNVTHNEVTNYKVGDTYTTLITPKPPSTDELITRFTNAIKAFKTAFETNPDEVGAVKS